VFLSQTAVGFRNRPKPLVESLEYPLDEIVIVIWYTGMSENYTFEPDRAHHLLRELVMAGVLDPEQPLSEPNLAYSLAVGHTPVREAIKRTTGEGLVEVRPAGGTYIRQITRADVLEIYEVRYGVEGIAPNLAAERFRLGRNSSVRARVGARTPGNSGRRREMRTRAGPPVNLRSLGNGLSGTFADHRAIRIQVEFGEGR
jgi:hypothetical protein